MRAAPSLCLLAALAGCNFPDPDLRPAPPRRAAFGEATLVSHGVTSPSRASAGGEFTAWESEGGMEVHSIYDLLGSGATMPVWPVLFKGSSAPALSSDGRVLALVASDATGGHPGVYLATIAAPEARLLASDPQESAACPACSPDGRLIAWEASESGGLWVTEVRNSQRSFLADGSSPSWSPDGQWIAFVRDSSVWKVRPDGTERTRLTENRDARRPTWSPDSLWIAFGQFDADGRADDIWAVRADGSRFLRVTWDPAPEWDPCWAPDGRVLFTTIRNGSQGIWVVAPENTELLK